MAGRAGRDRAPGRVIVQTYAPGHAAIRPVRDHDYEAFYAEELGQRAALGYPPFGRLVQALVSGGDAEATLAGAQTLAQRPRRARGPGEPEVLGPAPAPIARLRGKHRFQLLLKGADAGAAARRRPARRGGRREAPARRAGERGRVSGEHAMNSRKLHRSS